LKTSPTSSGSTTGCTTMLRTIVRHTCVRDPLACAPATSCSTSAVSTVSITKPCRLTIVRCSPSPLSPNSAAAIGMPTCTALP